MPSLDIDPFSDSFFAAPYPAHEALREAGPVVWLPKYGVAAVARFAEVRKLLMDWQSFSSAPGVGLANLKEEARFRLPSLLLESQ